MKRSNCGYQIWCMDTCILKSFLWHGFDPWYFTCVKWQHICKGNLIARINVELLSTITPNGVCLHEGPWHTMYLWHGQSLKNNAVFFFLPSWEVLSCSCHSKGLFRSCHVSEYSWCNHNHYIIKCSLRNVLSLFRI